MVQIQFPYIKKIKVGRPEHFLSPTPTPLRPIGTFVPNSPQYPDTGQNSYGGISNFWISGQSLINKSCHDSTTTNNIDKKLEKNLTVTSYWKVMTLLLIFFICCHLEQTES